MIHETECHRTFIPRTAKSDKLRRAVAIGVLTSGEPQVVRSPPSDISATVVRRAKGHIDLVNAQIRIRYLQTGFYSVMLIAIIFVLSLIFTYLLPAPRIDVPAQIISTVLPRQGQLERIKGALAEDIAGGSIAVEPFGSWVAIKISNVVAFASGDAHVLPNCIGILRRIADVVEAEKGPVRIVGYTDDQPLRPGGAFRDNQALSVARAEAVAALVRPALSDHGRIAIAGRGSDEPITANATTEGRAQNRRVEVLVARQP